MGKNEHLRSFEIQYPPRKAIDADASGRAKSHSQSDSQTTALGRSSLFTTGAASKKEAYQRVLRLSPFKSINNSRIGAIATSLEPKGEIVIFDASRKSPTSQDVRRRIRLGEGEEAADMDIITGGDEDYILAYCTDYEVYVTKISSAMGATQPGSLLVHADPHPEASASTKAQGKFRSLRFLQPNLLLLLQNKVSRGGADLILLELPSSQSLGTVILRKNLHKAIKAATAMSVCRLAAPTLVENSQSVVAVAGQDNSISFLTLDHPQQKPIPSLKFRSHAVLRNVHANIITSVTFADFKIPSELKSAPPQYIKLASASVERTVVVHTLPLIPYPTASRSRKPSRYVLTPPGRSEATQTTFSVLISAFVIALGAFLLQAFTEIRGGTPEYLGAKNWLSERIHGWIARPYVFGDEIPKAISIQAAEVASSAKQQTHSTKIPGVDDLKAPGIEPNPVESVKSVAAEITDIATGKLEEAKEGASEAGKSIKETVQEATERAAEGAQKAQKSLGLRQLLSRRSSSESASSETSPSDIIVQHDENSKSLSADIRDAETVMDHTHKKWEELEAHERETWKRRLIDAGEWAVEEGEAVLKGVFFQNIALAVGAAVGHGMGG